MNRIKYLVLIWALMGLFTACDKQLPIEHVFSVEESFDFEEDWRLRLVDIPEDSRCPEFSQCIWEGRVICLFELVMMGDLVQDFSLSLGAKTEVPNDTLLQGFYFELLEVKPFPEANKEIKISDYRAKVLIEKY